MIDVHCHILPLIDDGAGSWEVAEKMCAIALADGITHLVATPHANSFYEYNRDVSSGMLTELQRRVEGRLRFSLGCDFNISYENIQLLFTNPSHYVIEGTKYLLIEFSDFSIPPRFEDLLFSIRTELQLTPILTHPERHPILQVHPEYVLPWSEAGCVVQVTANSLTGSWGKRAKEAAVWLLTRGVVKIVATDAHDVKQRPPILSAARDMVAQLIGEAGALDLVENNPRSVVEGREIGSLSSSPRQ